ncbi:MAG: glycosyltransferase family 39 protein, partial [Chloroflexi bacterium]|nr:glycosyltransferase family 39 protein [Chloroflexota bacterium]
HYLETDVPVTFFITLTVYWLIDVAQQGRWRDYLLAGVSAGLAIGTKWSALPLLPVLLVAHGLGQPAWWRPSAWLGRAQLGRLLVLGVALLATFFLTNPYVLLNPTASAGGAAELGGSLFGNVGPGAFVAGLAQLFADTLPASLGWGLYLLGGTGLIAALLHRRRTPVETLALVWIGLFGMVAAVTYNATVGRTLPLAPFFILLAVAAVDRARRWVACSRPRGAALAAAVALAVALALGPSLVAGLFFYCSDTASQDASRWIQANVPAGSTFGLYNQDPYWDDPDLLYEDFFHPPAGGSRYRYVVYPLDAANPPYPDVEYLIWTQRDARKVGELLTPEQAAALTRWMDERYEPVADFESVVRVLGLEFRDLHQTFITSHIHVLKLK